MLNRDEPMTEMIRYEYSEGFSGNKILTSCTVVVADVAIATATIEHTPKRFILDGEIEYRAGEAYDIRGTPLTSEIPEDSRAKLRETAETIGRIKMIELQHAFSLVEDL